jgi:peptidoglycan/xylan/chitin deacetylase (PgdA/CDA1 family)
MRKWIKGPALFAFQRMGGAALLRTWPRQAIRILTYHRFDRASAGLLAGHCEYLRRHYHPVSLAGAVEYVAGRRATPPRTVVITVDDGYEDFFTVAYPIFSAYRIPVSVFVVTDFLDRKCWLWWDRIVHAFIHTAASTVQVPFPQGQRFRFIFTSRQDRLDAAEVVIQAALKISNPERLAFLADLDRLLNVELPPEPPDEYAPLTWEQVRHMAATGIAVGCHTKTHPILSQVSDPDDRRREILGSKARLEEELQEPVREFCYPNGGADDFDSEITEMVRLAGFESAVTTELGWNFAGRSDPFRLRRVLVETDMPESIFRGRVDGQWRIVQ